MSPAANALEYYYRLLAISPIGAIIFFVKIVAFIIVVFCLIGLQTFNRRKKRIVDGFKMKRPDDT